MTSFITGTAWLTLLYVICLWLVQKISRWRYNGLLKIMLTAAYLISIFSIAGSLQGGH